MALRVDPTGQGAFGAEAAAVAFRTDATGFDLADLGAVAPDTAWAILPGSEGAPFIA